MDARVRDPSAEPSSRCHSEKFAALSGRRWRVESVLENARGEPRTTNARGTSHAYVSSPIRNQLSEFPNNPLHDEPEE
jgi:hypothetical protein